MNYSDDQLKLIKELASNLTPISDMAVILDIDINSMRGDIRDRSTTISKIYYSAKAETSLKLRKQEIELAAVGSPLAVQLTKDYLINMDTDENL